MRLQRHPRLLAWLIGGGTVLIFLALSVVLSLRYAPSVIGQGRDSGIFAYTGKMIREGGLPYRDLWDNKPPGVYYLDALAFLLFGTTRWAIWFVDTGSVFAASLVLFWLVRRFDRRWLVAGLGSTLLILLSRSPLLIWDTNFTETYALPWQIACFALGFQFLRAPRFSTGFLLGLSACMAFMYKQTTIAVALTYIPAILLAHHPVVRPLRRFALGVGSMIAGGLSGLAVVALYLYGNGILGEAADATFLSAGSFHKWVSGHSVSFFDTLEMTASGSVAPAVIGPVVPFLIAAVLVIMRRIGVKRYSSQRAAAVATLSVWAGLTFLLDLGLANITYRAYEHYYTTMIPALILLVITGLAMVPGRERWPDWASYLVLGGASAYLLAVMGTGTGWHGHYPPARSRLGRDAPRAEQGGGELCDHPHQTGRYGAGLGGDDGDQFPVGSQQPKPVHLRLCVHRAGKTQ